LLKKYIPDAKHVIDWNVIHMEQESYFQVHLVHIMDQKIKHLWNPTIDLVNVQWMWCDPEDATWEHEVVIREEYLHLFEDF
jgi:hypothetical protein